MGQAFGLLGSHMNLGSGNYTFVLNAGDGFSTSTDTLLYAGSDHLGTVSNAKLIETEDGIWGTASRPLA